MKIAYTTKEKVYSIDLNKEKEENMLYKHSYGTIFDILTKKGYLFTSGGNKRILVYDIILKKLIYNCINGHTSTIYRIVFLSENFLTEDEKKKNVICLCSLSDDCTIGIWKIPRHSQPKSRKFKKNEKFIQNLSPSFSLKPRSNIGKDVSSLRGVIELPNGNLVTGTTGAGQLDIWDTSTINNISSNSIFTLDISNYKGVSSMAYLKKTERLIVSMNTEQILIYGFKENFTKLTDLISRITHPGKYYPPRGNVYFLRTILLKNSKYLFATCSSNKNIYLYDKDYNFKTIDGAHSNWIRDIIELKNGNIISCSEDHLIKIWDINTLQLIKEYKFYTNSGLYSFCFIEDRIWTKKTNYMYSLDFKKMIKFLIFLSNIEDCKFYQLPTEILIYELFTYFESDFF